jgi:hypothetical protein
VGVEWQVACLTCNEYAWLGSLKPSKWDGFQIGNRIAAEIFAQHTAAACDLIVDADGAVDTWSHRGRPRPGWPVDVRSHLESDQPTGCATCGQLHIDDALAIGEQLEFCSTRCRDDFSCPPRIWRIVPSVVELASSCRQCNTDYSATSLARGSHRTPTVGPRSAGESGLDRPLRSYHPAMSESYEQLRAGLRDRTALVYLDVQPPRDAPIKQFVASLFELAPDDEERHPQGQATSIAVTAEQARELLAAGAEWKGPAHLRAEVLPDT